MRIETDFIGSVELPDDFPFGIHTFRAMHNFAFSAERIRGDLFAALVEVKKAAALANVEAGLLPEDVGDRIAEACDEIGSSLDTYIPPLHPLQGGAGTSTNMAANELIANLALKRMGKPFGAYETISPLATVNLSQSTNDTYPTAVRIAVIRRLKKLHRSVETLLEALLAKEREFASILKIGRTELQDAMPLSLGQEFSAWAESVSRFRWRLDKAGDWVREVNISGTAVGTGINADRGYAMHVIDFLRRIVKEPLALARNLVDGTQNVDSLVEVSGLVRTGAVSIKKMAFDLRLLSSGPRCGFGEISLPPLQAGSSIMPGKVNPVMLEAAEQVCLQVIGGDAMIAVAAAESNLELPQFLPFIAHTLLGGMELLETMITALAGTIRGITANTKTIADHLNRSYAVATLLAPTLGHETVAALIGEATRKNKGFLDLIREKDLLDEETLKKLMTPEIMASPGVPLPEKSDDR